MHGWRCITTAMFLWTYDNPQKSIDNWLPRTFLWEREGRGNCLRYFPKTQATVFIFQWVCSVKQLSKTGALPANKIPLFTFAHWQVAKYARLPTSCFRKTFQLGFVNSKITRFLVGRHKLGLLLVSFPLLSMAISGSLNLSPELTSQIRGQRRCP